MNDYDLLTITRHKVFDGQEFKASRDILWEDLRSLHSFDAVHLAIGEIGSELDAKVEDYIAAKSGAKEK